MTSPLTSPPLYPSELPNPADTLAFATVERRMTFGRPIRMRDFERGFRAFVKVEFNFNATQAAVFRDWWEDTLDSGLRTFKASWPNSAGFTEALYRFRPNTVEWKSFGFEAFNVVGECAVYRTDLVTPIEEEPFVVDLYMKFDEADATQWLDYSPFSRSINILPRSTGTITGVSGGSFGRGGRFTQAYPGSRLAEHYPYHSCATASGNIDVNRADWVVHLVVNRSVLDIAFGMTLLTTGTAGASGIFIHMYRNVPAGWIDVVCSVSINPGSPEVQEVRVVNVGGFSSGGDAGSNHLYSFSRDGSLFTSFRDGLISQQNLAFEDADSIIRPTRGFTRIGAGAQSETPTPALIDSFDGMLDELYIAHGPGTGISANFSMPVAPWG